MSLKTDMTEVTNWLRKDRDSLLKDVFDDIGIEGENKLKEEAKDMSTSGKNYNSILYRQLNQRKNFAVSIEAKAPHSTIALETGRKPGKMPNYKDLIRWARLKGMENPKQAAFLVGRKIARVGTRKYINKGPKLFTKVTNQMEKRIDKFYLPKIIDIFS